MINRINELNVDFIGGQTNLPTKDKLNAISAFIKQSKEQRNKNLKRKSIQVKK